MRRDYSALKMKAIFSSETLVSSDKSTWCYHDKTNSSIEIPNELRHFSMRAFCVWWCTVIWCRHRHVYQIRMSTQIKATLAHYASNSMRVWQVWKSCYILFQLHAQPQIIWTLCLSCLSLICTSISPAYYISTSENFVYVSSAGLADCYSPEKCVGSNRK